MRTRKPLLLITATMLIVTLLVVPVSIAQNAAPALSATNPSTATGSSVVAASWSGWDYIGGSTTASPAAYGGWGSGTDLFARGSDGALWAWGPHISPYGWLSLGGQLVPNTGPAVTGWDWTGAWPVRMYLFAVGTDHAVWYKYYEPLGFSSGASGWKDLGGSGWKSLGGYATASPAAISWGFNHVEVFARGSDGALWHKWTFDGGSSWSNWESLGGILAPNTGPAASSEGYSKTKVFVVGTDRALYVKNFYSPSYGWNSDWEHLGGYATSSPAAAATTSQGNVYGVDLYARGSDGALWHKSTREGVLTLWYNWESLGGILYPNTGPAATSKVAYVPLAAKHLDVYVVGMNNGIYHKSYDP